MNLSVKEFIKSLGYAIYEIVLLPMSGLHATFYLLPLWYLSCVLLMLSIIIYLALRLPDLFTLLILGVPIYVYGYLSTTYGEVDIWYVWTGFGYIGLWRVAAGLYLGFLCERLVRFVQGKAISSSTKCFISAICFAAFFICTFYKGHSKFDFLLIAILITALCFLMADSISNSKYFMKKGICLFLGKLSVPLYTSHWIVRYLVATLMPAASYWQLIPFYLISSLLLALILYFCVEQTKKYATCHFIQ